MSNVTKPTKKCEKCNKVKSVFEFMKFKVLDRRSCVCAKCVHRVIGRVKEATVGG